MTLGTVLPADAKPACADDLDLVDKAFKHLGGPEAHWIKDKLCPRCPIAATCLEQAVLTREHGIWGGTSEYQRTRDLGPVSYTNNIVGIDHGHIKYVSKGPVEKFSVVRAWAAEQGIPVASRGRPPAEVYAAFEAARDAATAS